MRKFTCLLQVLNTEGNWGHLVDPHSGRAMFRDVVSVSDTSDAELPRIAQEMMNKIGAMELKRRVLFFAGDRRDVTVDDAYGFVEEGSSTLTLLQRQCTWALQISVIKAEDPSGWKMAPAHDGIVAGVATLSPDFKVTDWAMAGPPFLERVVSESGAPEGHLYRLLIWEGVIPVPELDPDRSVASIYR